MKHSLFFFRTHPSFLGVPLTKERKKKGWLPRATTAFEYWSRFDGERIETLQRHDGATYLSLPTGYGLHSVLYLLVAPAAHERCAQIRPTPPHLASLRPRRLTCAGGAASHHRHSTKRRGRKFLGDRRRRSKKHRGHVQSSSLRGRQRCSPQRVLGLRVAHSSVGVILTALILVWLFLFFHFLFIVYRWLV